MLKRVAAIDIDGVVGNYYPALEQRLGVTLPPHLSYNFAEYPSKLKRRVVKAFQEYETYQDMPLLSGAKAALHELAAMYTVVLVTSRGGKVLRPDIEQTTWHWVEQNALPVLDVVFARGLNKVHSLQANGYRAIFGVDDNPRVIDEYSLAGVWSYVIDWPYNQHCNGNHCVRVKDLAGVVQEERVNRL
jgi:hypothetical protein